MERTTDRETAKEIEQLKEKTLEDELYVRLAMFENLIEDKKLFNKRQLNKAIINSVEMLADIVKIKITKEVVYTIIAESEIKSKKDSIALIDLKEICNEVIKRVEER